MRYRSARSRRAEQAKRRRTRRRGLIAAPVVGVLEGVGLWLRSGRIAGNVIVRCRAGHLFTTIWIPGASLKSLRLGPWRVQRCPVGHHWSVVTPVREADLTEAEREAAAEQRDIRIP